MIIYEFKMGLINYNQLSKGLSDKYKATHDEIRYWIKSSFLDPLSHPLSPYLSDLPIDGGYKLPDMYLFYPEYFFYDEAALDNFIPDNHQRFVYRIDLISKRNWHESSFVGPKDSLVYKILYRANECGILRLYDSVLDNFTLRSPGNQLWCHTFEGEEILANPNSFFLLHDILTIERVFFNKDKKICMDELLENKYTNPPNIIKLEKKFTKGKELYD